MLDVCHFFQRLALSYGGTEKRLERVFMSVGNWFTQAVLLKLCYWRILMYEGLTSSVLMKYSIKECKGNKEYACMHAKYCPNVLSSCVSQNCRYFQHFNGREKCDYPCIKDWMCVTECPCNFLTACRLSLEIKIKFMGAGFQFNSGLIFHRSGDGDAGTFPNPQISLISSLEVVLVSF